MSTKINFLFQPTRMPSNEKHHTLVKPSMIIVLLTMMLAPMLLWAQPTFNRKVEALSVVPSTSGNPRTFDMTAFFSVDAANVVKATNLSTLVLFNVNGEVVERQRFNIQA